MGRKKCEKACTNQKVVPNGPYRAGLHLRFSRRRTLFSSPSISAPLNLWKEKKHLPISEKTKNVHSLLSAELLFTQTLERRRNPEEKPHFFHINDGEITTLELNGEIQGHKILHPIKWGKLQSHTHYPHSLAEQGKGDSLEQMLSPPTSPLQNRVQWEDNLHHGEEGYRFRPM